MDFLRYRKFSYALSGTLVAVSIASLLLWGLKLGIDFTGGSILEVEYKDTRPEHQLVRENLAGLDLGELQVQPTGDRGIFIRFKNVDEETHQKILEALNREKIEEKRFDSVGPAIGKELEEKSKKAIVFVLAAILFYIMWAFRRVSKPVSSFRYGIIAIIALFHDVVITAGVFSILGNFFGIEVGIPFVGAILTVLGYSVNDTIVVFDRIRENLIRESAAFERIVSKSLQETMVRSFNTSFTVILVLLATLFFGGETIRYFVLALIIGVSVGTYSSIFLASPMLVDFGKQRFPFRL